MKNSLSPKAGIPPVPALCPDCQDKLSDFVATFPVGPDSPPLVVYCEHTLTSAVLVTSETGLQLWYMIGPLPREVGVAILKESVAGFEEEQDSKIDWN